MELKDSVALIGLIAAVKDGNEAAFEELVNLYKPMIDSAIRKFSLDARDAL